jgi:hypothetical protein
MAHGTRAARRNRPIGEQEWIQVINTFTPTPPHLSSISYPPPLSLSLSQCCDPHCGKWRALHRSMDAASAVLNNEWYCVMNTWDEALASCAAPQEIPSEAARERTAAANAHIDGGGETQEDPRSKKVRR